MRHYLLKMIGDVEPEISCPYASYGQVLNAARHHRAGDVGMSDGLYAVRVDGHGNLEIVAFPACELAEN